jgi:hypothetical protein
MCVHCVRVCLCARLDRGRVAVDLWILVKTVSPIIIVALAVLLILSVAVQLYSTEYGNEWSVLFFSLIELSSTSYRNRLRPYALDERSSELSTRRAHVT